MFLLLTDTAYNALKRVLTLPGKQSEMHARMEGNGVNKCIGKGKDLLRFVSFSFGFEIGGNGW